MKKIGEKVLIISAVLAVLSCSNPVDLVQEATEIVMAANSRYIEVVSLSPEPNESDISGTSQIVVSFDREVDPSSLTGNISVTYSDNSGVNQYSANSWTYDYNSGLKKLTIDPNPWIDASKTVTIRIGNIKGMDGSELIEPLEWTFSSSSDAVFNISFGTKTTTETVANIAMQTARAGNSIPVLLEFSRSTALKYFLSTSGSDASSFDATDYASWTLITDETDVDSNPSTYTIETSYILNSDGTFPLYLWVYDTEANGGSGKLLSFGEKTDYVYILVDRTAPSGNIYLESETESRYVSATTSFYDVNGVVKQEFRNDGDSVWTVDTTPQSSRTITLRNNSGLREVYYRIYDSAGNYSEHSDTTNFLMPVNVRLEAIKVDDSNETGSEEWFWDFDVNGEDAFSRAEASYFSYDIVSGGGVIGLINKLDPVVSIPAAYKDANSAMPYTSTIPVDVSLPNAPVSISGYVGEDDDRLPNDYTDTDWFTYITMEARNFSSSWPKFTNPLEIDLDAGSYLSGVHIFVKYWTSATYAAMGS
jgi:hypothetical protein